MPERYPIVRAGKRVTGAFLESFQPLVVRKTADTGRTTTTAAADPELQLTVEANATYLVTAVLHCSNTTANDDINIDFTAPSGADGTWGGHGLAINVAADTADARMASQGVDTAKSFGTDDGGGTAPTPVFIMGMLITGSTSGTYSIDWCQNNATGTLTVYQDSWLRLDRIA